MSPIDLDSVRDTLHRRQEELGLRISGMAATPGSVLCLTCASRPGR